MAKIVIITVVGLASILLIGLIPPNDGGQRRNMKLAQSHRAIVSRLLAQDPRFRGIEAAPFTGVGGSLVVSGALASEGDRSDLEALVRSTNPPVKVVYLLVPPEAGK